MDIITIMLNTRHVDPAHVVFRVDLLLQLKVAEAVSFNHVSMTSSCVLISFLHSEPQHVGFRCSSKLTQVGGRCVRCSQPGVAGSLLLNTAKQRSGSHQFVILFVCLCFSLRQMYGCNMCV